MQNIRYAINRAFVLLAIATVPLFINASAFADPVAIDPSVTLSLFDEGGVLDYSSANGHIGAIEVATNGDVYVVVYLPNLGVLTNALQLVKSTGLQTATNVGAPQAVQVMPWASDLTLGSDGWLYVAGAFNDIGGIYGLDPDGLLPPRTYANSDCVFSTSGLTFSSDNSFALISTDGSQTTCRNGLYRVGDDGTTEHLISQLAVPDGIPRGADDHAVMLDGRIILAGDKSHDLWDATAGAGNVFVAMDLDLEFVPDDNPGWFGGDPVFGSRIAVDPVTGDLFYSHGTGNAGKLMSIVRVKADFSEASIFAQGFSLLRDLDFGPANENNERSLYITELKRAGEVPSDADLGAIYRIEFPADTDADSIEDLVDNCTLKSNIDQRDTDGDGYGNACDPDLNNDGVVAFSDLALWIPFFNTVTNGDADFDGNGSADFGDFAVFPDFFLQPPGPSGVAP